MIYFFPFIFPSVHWQRSGGASGGWGGGTDGVTSSGLTQTQSLHQQQQQQQQQQQHTRGLRWGVSYMFLTGDRNVRMNYHQW